MDANPNPPQQEKTLDWNQIDEPQGANEDKNEQRDQKQRNKPKPVMQSRGEIEKLIDDCPDQEILLNIVKCHFDAKVEDVKNTFPNFEFLKVENYNNGSFSLLFKSKQNAKDFLYMTKDSRILGRGFWIKFPVRYQKSSQKIPENLNREQPLRPQGKKFSDAPPKHKDSYNRKESGDHEGGFKQEDKQGHQQQKKYYNNRKKDEDEGWVTVMPHHIYKKNNNYQPKHHNQRKQQQ